MLGFMVLLAAISVLLALVDQDKFIQSIGLSSWEGFGWLAIPLP